MEETQFEGQNEQMSYGAISVPLYSPKNPIRHVSVVNDDGQRKGTEFIFSNANTRMKIFNCIRFNFCKLEKINIAFFLQNFKTLHS